MMQGDSVTNHGTGSAPVDGGGSGALHPTSLLELSLLFLRLGATAFGGPAAHIAMMQDEVVRRRGWLTEAEYLDLISACNMIPGPNSTEMAIHVGWQRRRWSGLLAAGLSFILPAALITGVLGWVYVRFGSLPELGWVLYGVKPVILAVVVQAIWGLAPKAAPSAETRALSVLAILAAALCVNEMLVLFGAGAVLASARAIRGHAKGGMALALVPLLPVAGTPAAVSAVTLPGLFWVFCRTGAVLFGSGYVLLAFLRADLVERLGWMTEAQLIDSIAVGQVTPGPVFTTATFIGYLLSGPSGAVVATAGIFLPAFIFVALSGPLVPRLRASAFAGSFLDGVNVASLALMAVVTVQLASAALVDLPAALFGLLGAVLLLRFRMNSSWLAAGGALTGALVHWAGLAGRGW